MRWRNAIPEGLSSSRLAQCGKDKRAEGGAVVLSGLSVPGPVQTSVVETSRSASVLNQGL